MPTETKICASCQEEKPLSSFHRAKATADRLRVYCKDCQNQKARERTQKLKITCLRFYSKGTMVCSCCGESHVDFLTLEHLNGGGRKHREEVGKGFKFYGWLVKNNFPDGIGVLCYNWNCCKGHHGVCIHEVERG